MITIPMSMPCLNIFPTEAPVKVQMTMMIDGGTVHHRIQLTVRVATWVAKLYHIVVEHGTDSNNSCRSGTG